MPEIEQLAARNGQAILKARLEDGRELFLHSSYDPQKEALNWAAELNIERTSLVILYGLGLGYHLRALLSLHPCENIVVIEPNDEVSKIARELNEDLFEHEKVDMVNSWESFKDLRHQMGRRWQNIFFSRIPCYPQIYPQHYSSFAENLKRELTQVRADRATALLHAQQWQFNFLKNLRYLKESAPVVKLFNTFTGKPVILVSAGPSLEKNIHLLHQAKGKALILAVGTVVKLLAAHDITPDLVISFDGGEANYRHFEGLRLEHVPLIYDPAIHYKIVEEYAGPKAIMLVKAEWLEKHAGRPIGSLLTGPSVANTAFDLAYRLGADPIILAGQDLAYDGDRSHAEGTDVDTRPADVWVEGNLGSPVPTSRVMLTYLYWFENRFKQLVAGPTIINATEGGALIQGTQVLPLSEALTLYCAKDIAPSIEDLKSLIDERTDYDLGSLTEYLKSSKEALEHLLVQCKRGRRLSQKLFHCYSKGERRGTQEILKKLAQIDNKLNGAKDQMMLLEHLVQPVIAMTSHSVFDKDEHLDGIRQSDFLYSQLSAVFQFGLPLIGETIAALESQQ